MKRGNKNMNTLGIRLSLSIIGLLVMATPRMAAAAPSALHFQPPAAHAAPSGQGADPSIVG